MEVVALHKHGCDIAQATRDFLATCGASRSKTLNTIWLLQQLGALEVANDKIQIRADEFGDTTKLAIFLGRQIANRLVEKIVNERAVNCVQARGPNFELWLDSMIIPGVDEGLPLWVVDFSVASREKTGSRFWKLSDRHRELFIDSLRLVNREKLKKGLTADHLKNRLDAMAELGDEGESWVLEFERRRLVGHPLVDQITLVSKDDVTAGYDMVSFSGHSSLHYDLFIEVKTYANDRRFFWSQNEINVAKQLGEQYAIYLVSRKEMENPDYRPQIIYGPHSALFEAAHNAWSVTPTTFECVAKGGV